MTIFSLVCFSLLLMALQSRSKEYWPNFKVCGSTEPYILQQNHEYCQDLVSKHSVEEYKDKGPWTEQIFCFKSCMFVRNGIFRIEKTKDTGNITMPDIDDDHMGYRIGENYNNYRLGPPIADNIKTKCSKEVDKINEQKLHCNQWDDFYNCVINTINCCEKEHCE